MTEQKEPRMEFYMTAGINNDMNADPEFETKILALMNRFVHDDWGDLCEDDKELNRQAQKHGGRILAAYETDHGRVYIITDDAKAAVKVTTVLYASEY